MYSFSFNKSRAIEVVNALRNGDDISAPADGWTFSELLQVAAACHDRMRDWNRDDDLNDLIGFASSLTAEIDLGCPGWQIDDVVVCFVESPSESKFADITAVDGMRSHDYDPRRYATARKLRQRAGRRLPAIRRHFAELQQRSSVAIAGMDAADLAEQIATTAAIVASYERDLAGVNQVQ